MPVERVCDPGRAGRLVDPAGKDRIPGDPTQNRSLERLRFLNVLYDRFRQQQVKGEGREAISEAFRR